MSLVLKGAEYEGFSYNEQTTCYACELVWFTFVATATPG